GVRGGGVQVHPGAGHLGAGGQRLAEHHRVGAAGDGFGDVTAGGDVAVGDDVHVPAAGLVQVVPARRGRVGDRGGHRHVDAEHVRRAGTGVGPVADDDAGGAGAHQVQRGLVVRAAADDHRDVQLGDERLEVQRLAVLGHVL